MRASFSFLLAAALGAAAAAARSATGDRVLVVLGPQYKRDEYSRFWASLESRGFDLTFAAPDAPSTSLESYGEPNYDHLILLAPEATSFAGFKPQTLLDAQSRYLNTLIVASPSTSAPQRALLREYDVEAAPEGYVLSDVFSHVGGENSTDVVLPPSSLVAPAPILESKNGPVAYPDGTAFLTGLNPFLVDVAKAPRTAFLAGKNGKAIQTPAGQEVKWAGASVAAAMQTRQNVRIGFVGSPLMLADKWYGEKLDAKATGNGAVVDDFAKWIFQETGVVRVVRTEHHREGETEALEAYRKRDNVTYAITLAQHVTKDGSPALAPFSVSDLQLEFTMLDPHIRTDLVETASTAEDTTYSVTFTAPDRHGVFKFVVDYFRPGWTFITAADKASVVPLRHDEHPRFIQGAYPFYTGALSTSAAFIFFCALWISLAEGDKGKKKAE